MSTTNNKVILLTGCVNPNGMPQTVLQNPEIRKQQYVSAIRYYLKKVQIPIVFVENSNTDISHKFQKEVNDGRIEFVVFNGNDFDKKRGKGYGEAIMIEYALSHARFLKVASFVIKITGRLIIDNINELVREMKSPDVVYANLIRGHCGMERRSYFFGTPIPFLYDFISQKDLIDESAMVYFERHLYNESLRWKENGGVVKELWHPIIVSGISGSNGKNYEKESFPYLKAWIRYFLHRSPFYK